MTEYETASLAIQQASLAIQQASLAISRAGVWISGIIGFVQCVLIAGGLWLMHRAATTRDKQHEEAKDRHQETMAALQQQGEALQQQGEALRTLIERTARN